MRINRAQKDAERRLRSSWSMLKARAQTIPMNASLHRVHAHQRPNIINLDCTAWMWLQGSHKSLRTASKPVVIADTSSHFQGWWPQYLNATKVCLSLRPDVRMHLTSTAGMPEREGAPLRLQ